MFFSFHAYKKKLINIVQRRNFICVSLVQMRKQNYNKLQQISSDVGKRGYRKIIEI